MQPGQPYAISITNSGSPPMNVELWGTDTECGVANELLWWAEWESKIQCASFTPTAAHSDVLFVRRTMREATNYIYQTSAVTLCANGSCPAGNEGEGLMSGGELVTPLAYDLTGGGTFRGGHTAELGGYGNIVKIWEGPEVPEGTPRPVSAGFFKTNKDDPFGDAWYCIGAGSTVTNWPDDTYTYSLKNITRVGDCLNSTGTGNANVSITGFDADITGTFPELSGPAQSADTDCLNTYCRFQFEQNYVYSWLFPTATSDLGSSLIPTGQMSDVEHAAWFVQPSEGAPIQMTCAGSGSITINEGLTTVELSEMSDYVTCPGEATDVTEFEFTGY
jgi:hypothetical protein